MNSVNDVWNEVMKVLSQKLTPTSIKTWFSDCYVTDLSDNCLTLITSNNFKRDVIQNRYTENIKSALSDLFSYDFNVIVITEDEKIQLPEETDSENNLPEMAEYTFDRFIVGASNQLAHAAAIAVAKNPGAINNPLFIYGNSGLGKTHLLFAIGHDLLARNPKSRVAYVKGDDFTNEMVRSLKNGTTDDFRNRYRNVDLFLVDDIQFIAGKQQTQNEFFHTFNSIYESGHQIVVTSDRPPKEMSLLEDRLISRFEGGLMVDIQPPDLETRIAITKNKATQFGLIISDEAVSFIAENVTANIRQIEGVLKRLTAFKEILNEKITIDSARRAIDDIATMEEYVPSPERIMKETSRYFNLTEEDLRGENRSKNTMLARQISMYLMRTLTRLSLKDIGFYFKKNHSTVLSSIRKIEESMKLDANLSSVIRDIISNINS